MSCPEFGARGFVKEQGKSSHLKLSKLVYLRFECVFLLARSLEKYHEFLIHQLFIALRPGAVASGSDKNPPISIDRQLRRDPTPNTTGVCRLQHITHPFSRI